MKKLLLFVLSIILISGMTEASVILFNSPDPAMRASLQVIIPVVAVTAAFFIVGIWLSLKTLRTKPFSGDQGLLGQEGDARTLVNKAGGRVFVSGTHWSAWAETEITEGSKIRVVETKGMVLKVEKL
jgi:membrane-bound serine protease (ClpP class)